MPTGRARFLAALSAAHVQFVMGAEGGRRRLLLAVASHPSNLAALGAVLDQFGATLRSSAPQRGGLRRLSATSGVLRVHVPGADVDLLLDVPGSSSYAELREIATPDDLDGVSVLVALFPSRPRPTPDRSSAAVAGRLLAMADELAKSVPQVDRDRKGDDLEEENVENHRVRPEP